jgi:uncharacterized protein YndB with AHSA1/START domain
MMAQSDIDPGIDLQVDPRAIIAVRVFDAPRDLVFAVWSDPRHLARAARLSHHYAQLRHARGRRLAIRDARTGRARLPEPHHL